MDKKELTNIIKRKCLEAGFQKAGVARAEELLPEKDRLNAWLSNGMNAGMEWMHRSSDKRTNPMLIEQDVKSVISLAYVYNTPVKQKEGKDYPKISRYAWGSRDYHKVIKKKLKPLCAEIEALGEGIKTRYYVDDGPMMDKAWAAKAGIGWMGKNTNIITQDIGSFFFLTEILLNAELEYDEPIEDMCRGCRLCLKSCPTGALYEPYKLDANKCISYHTIENRGEIPGEITLNGWVFGCDICQDVCPYNLKPFFTDDINFYPRENVISKTYDELLEMNEEEFNKTFEGTPVRRTKYAGWIRNLRKAKEEVT
jgi:epoxyqueuosine reductase